MAVGESAETPPERTAPGEVLRALKRAVGPVLGSCWNSWQIVKKSVSYWSHLVRVTGDLLSFFKAEGPSVYRDLTQELKAQTEQLVQPVSC